MNLGGFSDSLKIKKGEKLIKYVLLLFYYGLDRKYAKSAGNITLSKRAARRMKKSARQSETFARAAGLCSGFGTSLGLN